MQNFSPDLPSQDDIEKICIGRIIINRTVQQRCGLLGVMADLQRAYPTCSPVDLADLLLATLDSSTEVDHEDLKGLIWHRNEWTGPVTGEVRTLPDYPERKVRSHSPDADLSPENVVPGKDGQVSATGFDMERVTALTMSDTEPGAVTPADYQNLKHIKKASDAWIWWLNGPGYGHWFSSTEIVNTLLALPDCTMSEKSLRGVPMGLHKMDKIKQSRIRTEETARPRLYRGTGLDRRGKPMYPDAVVIPESEAKAALAEHSPVTGATLSVVPKPEPEKTAPLEMPEGTVDLGDTDPSAPIWSVNESLEGYLDRLADWYVMQYVVDGTANETLAAHMVDTLFAQDLYSDTDDQNFRKLWALAWEKGNWQASEIDGEALIEVLEPEDVA